MTATGTTMTKTPDRAPRKRRLAPLAAALLGAALLPGTALAAADVTAAEAIIAEHSLIPTFTPPGTPFDAKSCMAGKKILTIPTSSAIPFNAGIVASMEEVAKEVGFELRVWQNQGQPTQWVQGIEYAIQNGHDAVDLVAGIVPDGLAPQLTAARKAGLKVFATHHLDVTNDRSALTDVELPVSFTRVGEIVAAWVIKQTGGTANVLVIGSDDVMPSQPYWKSFEATLKKLDPDSKATYVNVSVADWATKIQTSAQGALLQDPSINFIVPLYDSMAQFVLPALAITGRKADVQIATFNGTPFVIDMVRNGDVQMNVGESLGWIARSSLDAYMRSLCGQADVPTELYVPFFIFDKTNAETAGKPADFDKGYGDAHVAGYRKLWGLE